MNLKYFFLLLLTIPLSLLSQSYINFDSVEYEQRLMRVKSISEKYRAEFHSQHQNNKCLNADSSYLSTYLFNPDIGRNKRGLTGYNIKGNSGLCTDKSKGTAIFSSADSLALLNIDANCDISSNLNWDSEPNPMNWEGVTWDNGNPQRVRWLEIEEKSLSGVLDLTPLDSLVFVNCGFNSIDSLILNNLEQLTDVLCPANNLSFIDISSLNNLIYIEVLGNHITQINISDNNSANLEYLLCGGNIFIDLNCLSVLSNLRVLDISFMPLDSLSLPGNDSLYVLVCSYSKLKHLDLSNLTELSELYCHENNLTELIIDNQKKLWILYCWRNFLTKLDISNQPYMIEFECEHNKLTQLNFGNHPYFFQYFGCSNNRLTELDLSGGIQLMGCNVKNNKLPFSSLATKPDVSSHQSFFPQNTLYDTLSIEGNTTLDYSAEALIRDTYATEFIFYKDKNVADTNATGLFNTNGNGVYYCEMTNPLFPGYSLRTSPVTITGATEIITESEPQFSYYPNPVTDVLHINNAKNGKVQKLSICNIEGKELLLFKNASMPFDIDLTNYKSGLYICKLISNNKEYSFEIVKK